ncbi:hypothetical protein [Flaviaesturariibacter amylovorans]|uniref:hypothetical protein n=1 Tax=Flaviaesturariibacter amylovorans TaxID=1084520 RepID=UPI0031E92587
MKEEFTLVVDFVRYQFKRIYHPELALTYHVHFDAGFQPTVFRMRRNGSGEWKILPMQLPAHVSKSEAAFHDAIERNEETLQDFVARSNDD